jgi:nitroreductase
MLEMTETGFLETLNTMRPCHWCLPAIQNINLACLALGLGTVITTSHILYESEVGEILRLPDGVFTFALMPMGYSVENYGPLSRRPVSQIAFADRWGEPWTVHSSTER